MNTASYRSKTLRNVSVKMFLWPLYFSAASSGLGEQKFSCFKEEASE